MFNYYTEVLKKYAVFSGRANRAEYWYFILANIIVSIAVSIIARIIKVPALASLYSLAILIPGIAVGFRRLHDTGKSGWWTLITLIPVIGWIWFIILLAAAGNTGDNKYGPNPKGASAPAQPPQQPQQTV